jgi:hypothetical protein
MTTEVPEQPVVMERLRRANALLEDDDPRILLAVVITFISLIFFWIKTFKPSCLQVNNAVLKYERKKYFHGRRGTPSGNTIAVSVCLEYEVLATAHWWNMNLWREVLSCQVAKKILSGIVFLWGEVVGTMKKTSLLDDSDDERATKRDTISVVECDSE